MAESLTSSPIGSAPVSEFERLLTKQPSDFDKLLAKPLHSTPKAKTDFERLLEKDFKPAVKTTVMPKVKFRTKLGRGLKSAGSGGGGDDLIGLVQLGADLFVWTEKLKEERAIELGFKDDGEFNAAKEDVQIAAEFATIAEAVLSATKAELDWKKKKRRKKLKRTVIYGWTRR